MLSQHRLFVYTIVILSVIGVVFVSGCTQSIQSPHMEKPLEYDPKINPSDFTSNVSNQYFRLTPGKKMVYEAETAEGSERTETYVTHETKAVMDVEAIIVWDRVWLDGELIEETKDWYAQDKEGTVWYFGEDSAEVINGIIVSRAGSWEAGVDGAKPGIIMKANPTIGETYQQEYYEGHAEDRADVLAVDESVTTPFGTFDNCVKTLDYTLLEPDVQEHKYYCPGVGGVVLERNVKSSERTELRAVEYDATPSAATVSEELTGQIPEAQAKEIALREVPGTVTDVAIERKAGKIAYVVEVAAENGLETDVIIDIYTGAVLDVET